MTQYRLSDRDKFAWQDPVIDKDLTAPPGGESEGDRYIVSSPATGAWVGHENDIAEYNGSGWNFLTPADGWRVDVLDENKEYRNTGTVWIDVSGGAGAALWDQNGTRFSNRNFIAAGEYAEVVADEADGASAVGIIHDNKTALSIDGAKLMSDRNAGAEKYYRTHDGHPVLVDTVWDDVVVTEWAVTVIGSINPPDFVQLQDDGAGSRGVYAWHFDESQIEQLFFTVQLPHRWKPGTDIRFHTHWYPIDTDTGTVRWGLEYTIANVNGVLGNTNIIYVEDPADGTALKQQLAPFAAIGMSGKTESCLIHCRLFRDASHANDTYDNDAAIGSSDFHIEMEKLGTNNYAPPWGK